MTEESFQQARKLMRTANYLRGMITVAKGYVKTYTKLEDWNRKELKHGVADAIKKKLDKAIIKLEQANKKFADLKFPDHNLIAPKETVHECAVCNGVTTASRPICLACQPDFHP